MTLAAQQSAEPRPIVERTCSPGSLEPGPIERQPDRPVARRRVASLVIPQFFTDICLRVNPSLANRAVAVADGVSRREIIAVNDAARAVRLGMTPKQARAACPGLVVVARSEDAERAATQELLDALESCSPAVEGARPGVCFFDAGGLSDGEASALGAAVALASALGLRAAAAIADDKFTAYCAAVTGGGCSVVPPGGSGVFLAPLPVALLPLAPGDAERFEVLGLRVLGQIAALPTAPLAARFGERARNYSQLARGEDAQALQPRRAQTVHEDRFTFDEAVDRLEPLFFALRGCIGNVAARLAGSAQVCDRVEITLVLSTAIEREGFDDDEATVINIPVVLAEPTASAGVIFDLARIALESREQLGAVEAIIVHAAPCGEPPPQLGLFDGSAASRSAALAATLSRLRATLANGDVVTLQTQREKSRLPERMQRAVPVASPRQFLNKQSPPMKREWSGRIYSTEREARGAVECTRPWAPALRLLELPKPMRDPLEQHARAGPFRLSEIWWERPVERDYYQMVDHSGALVLAFRDVRDGRWYVQGIFD